MNLKENLLLLDIVIDNIYLDKYVKLIQDNILREKEKYKTQIHHIIPRCYFLKNNLKVDNTKNNKTNLLFKDHILAHYYLALCSKNNWFKINNVLAIQFMIEQKGYNLEKWKEKYLDKLQELYEETRKKLGSPLHNKDIYEKFLKIVKNETNRNKISNTMKNKAKNGELFSIEHRNNLSKSALNHIWINKDGIYTHIPKNKLQEYLGMGWSKGARPLSKGHQEAILRAKIGSKYTEEQKKKLRESHLGQVPWNKGVACKETTKKKLSEYFKNTKWMTNGEISKQVNIKDIDKYLKNGFTFGRKKVIK